MSLKDQLAEDLKDAMRQGDETRKTALRLTIAAIKNAEVPDVVTVPARKGDSFESLAARNRVDADRLAFLNPLAIDGDFEEGDPVVISQNIPVMDDEAIRAVISKQVKQRRDSIDAFQKANRQDLVDKEAAELKVLETYLPAQMSREDVAAEARKVVEEVGAKGPQDKGRVMAALMPRLAGRADGKLVNEAVTELLTSA